MSRRPIDFSRSRARTPVAGWCLLVAGALLLGASLWLRERHATEEDRIQALREQAEARVAAARPVAPSLPPVRETLLRAAQAQLRYPWLGVLGAVESATHEPVYLRALAIDPANGNVTLAAQAPSFDAAMAYVQMLDEDGVLAPAFLSAHQPGVDGFGNPVVTFTAVTRWSGH